MATKAREARDWELFVDWCASMGTNALPTTAEVIADFLTEFPAPMEAQGRRVRAIRKAHENEGVPLALPTDRRASVLREGPEWASVPRALAQLPTYGHPKVLEAVIRGRRDGWLIVLVGILGLSRNEARLLEQTDVELFPRLAIKGHPVPRTDPASECLACAVTRWLHVAGAASFGFRNELLDVISPIGIDPAAHDCDIGLDGVWRQANTLLPWVDRHGWVSADPMSSRSVSATLAHRQALGPVAEIRAYVAPTGGRYEHATMNELADAYDDVDTKVAAMLLHLNEILDESAEVLDHLKEFDL
ncbi:hypothetical protein [Cryobacterium zhongshanensis]|uniref:Recombinase n=1 Tax=Cryobacterium zhongshanensis TaxID=2928153 RepID=A0AA41QY33_9MICO|nr:hypothetical protein [Cryobacterium zhongshanensis]MCI4659672.1 hypothetical protein [Cryobacterium zhongshanensis]